MAEMKVSLPSNMFQNSSTHDGDFCTIFFEAARKLFDFLQKRNAEELIGYYGNFKDHFNIFFGFLKNPNHEDHDSEAVKALKKSPFYRIIYVLRNSPIVASAVAFHFQNTLKEDFSYMKKLIEKEKIKICSIGGGAASDVVAVVKILDLLANKMDKKLDFQITIIDSDGNWKETCFAVLSCIKNVHESTRKINFVQADISDENSYTAEVIKSIQEADLVLMVMLLYDFKNNSINPKETVKKICELMQYGSMIFLLDMDLIEYIQSCFGLSGETENFHLIYQNLSDIHFLDMEASWKAYVSYKEHFKHLYCISSRLPVFVRAWTKTPTKQISGTRNELQRLFKKDIENCDPEKTFLDSSIFEKWLKEYAARIKKNYNSERSVNKLLEEKRKNRMFFLDKFKKSKEMVEGIRKELIGENVLFEEGEHHGTYEIDHDLFEKYIAQKKEYSVIKKYAYDNIVIDKEIPKEFFSNLK